MSTRKSLYEVWHEEVKRNGWDNFLFRCSMLGKLASKPKSKSPKQKIMELKAKLKVAEGDAIPVFDKLREQKSLTKTDENKLNKITDINEAIEKLKPFENTPHLSETCKAYLANIYTEVMYNRKEDITSKYIAKGLLLEEDAITQHSLNVGKMFRKNTQRLSNGFIDGEFDYEDTELEIVKDAKVNWSIFQFNRAAAAEIDTNYWWQLKGYMWLKGYKKAELVYSLLNTPEHLIKQEEKKLLWQVQSEEDYEEACIELRRNHIYDDIPAEEKEKIFAVSHNDEDIEFIKQQIIWARDYLNNFSKNKKLKNESDIRNQEEVDE